MTTAAMQIVPGSIADMATRNDGQIIPPVLTVLFDTSYSMRAMDGRLEDGGSASRFEAGVEQLTKIQAQHPGQIVLIEFNNGAHVCPGGVPEEPRGYKTDLESALRLAKELDTGAMRFVVISDGQPDDEWGVREVAQTFSVGIDTIAIGSSEQGATFLEQLARDTKGTYHRDHSGLRLLAQTIRGLLPGGLTGTTPPIPAP